MELYTCRRFPAVPVLFDDSDIVAVRMEGIEENNESGPLHEGTRGRFHARLENARWTVPAAPGALEANAHTAYEGTPWAIQATVGGISPQAAPGSGSVSD
jgi:hypothetical protein